MYLAEQAGRFLSNRQGPECVNLEQTGIPFALTENCGQDVVRTADDDPGPNK